MKTALLVALTALFFAGCTMANGVMGGDCGDLGVKSEAGTVTPTPTDKDGDGYPVEKDCNDNDATVHPGAKEVCDGKDNDCNGKTDDNPTDAGKACGLSVGECVAGTVECINAKLVCDGPALVLPKNELCNGKDDDCDGEVDEDFTDLGKACDVGQGECKHSGHYVCNGSATKLKCDAVLGTPVIEGPPGSPICNNNLDDDCDGLMDGADEDCRSCATDAECADSNLCTMDKCLSGVCQHSALLDGSLCSNGIFCDGVETCVSGVCKSGPKVFCDDGKQCTTDSCNETQQKCVFTPVSSSGTEGSPGGATCLDGQDNDCDGMTDLEDPDCRGCANDLECKGSNPCINYYCTPSKQCASTPKSNGASCDDGAGSFCSGSKTCQNQICVSSGVQNCDDSNPCTKDECSEALRQCLHSLISGCQGCASAANCNDNNSCTVDSCVSGTCQNTPLSAGTACDDGQFCTDNDRCTAGGTTLVCTGTARDCSLFADSCNTSYCDETTDVCKKTPKANGTPCDSSLFCSGTKTCLNGYCQTGTAVVCNDYIACTVDTCSEAAKQCVFTYTPKPGAEGTNVSGTCTNGIDDDCDGLADYADPDCKQCQNDAQCYVSGLGQCMQAVCNLSTYQCQTTVKANGTTCDDSLFCTIGESCQNGSCIGGQGRNCYPGTCNESLDQCTGSVTGSGCADGTREGFTDQTAFPNIAGCSGTWSVPGLTNAYGLCASGWHICTGAADVASRLPSGKNCTDVWTGTEKRFFATLQPSQGNGYCNTTGTNDIFGCGNYGHPPQIGSCGVLNEFSSEDCSGIAIVDSVTAWQCGGSGDSNNELTTVVKLNYVGGGVLCCVN
ncbi:MAG: putative metal-binding motif-containing protein [Patescibacteria group bacterium]